MAETLTASPEVSKKETKADDDVHSEAMKRYERGYERDRKNQELGYQDLQFLAEEGQWEDRARRERDAEGRPILTVNKCPQFVRQVTGDMRQMKPSIKVVPVDDNGDEDVAKTVLPGMIRYIEQRSDAQACYFSAADTQVAAGIGHWRVLTEYAGNTTFEQELRIAPVEDGIGVVWDPDSIMATREDAMWCFVPVDMSRAAFKEKYPDKSGDAMPGAPELFRTWGTDDHVRVAEYWLKKPIKRKLAMLPNGAVKDLTDVDEAELADVMALAPDVQERDGFKVERYVISASDVLEGPDDWSGSHIPIVPLIGEEIKIGREIIRRGVIRGLKDVQRIYNYAISTEAEVVALQPKAPFIGTHKHFEKYADQWETANTRNWPYLEFEIDPANPSMKPDRVQPPVSSAGLKDLIAVAQADMSAVTGIYPAALGAQSNETSGKAIMARQREGDTGTFVYIDNFARAIRRTGQILIDLIPHVYDTARTIRIVGEDGKIDKLKINQEEIDPNGDGIATRVLHDLTIGAYDIAIEMGPSYSTKREEARDGMQAFMQAAGPEVAALYIDLFAKMQDWPLADKIAKRAQLMLPPPIQQLEAQESGEPPPPPMPPSPEQQAAMAQQQAEQQNQERQHALDTARLAIDEKKIEAEMMKINAEIEKARLGAQTQMAASSMKSAETEEKGEVTASDPRIDALAAAVEQLRDVVLQIADAIAGQEQEMPPDVPPEMPPDMMGGGMPPIEIPTAQPATGGFFVDENWQGPPQ